MKKMQVVTLNKKTWSQTLLKKTARTRQLFSGNFVAVTASCKGAEM
jgi:hypothetical protein